MTNVRQLPSNIGTVEDFLNEMDMIVTDKDSGIDITDKKVKTGLLMWYAPNEYPTWVIGGKGVFDLQEMLGALEILKQSLLVPALFLNKDNDVD